MSAKSGRPYSAADVQFMKANASVMTSAEIAVCLGRTERGINDTFQRLGIKKGYLWATVSKEKADRIVALWESEAIAAIARELGLTPQSVGRFADKVGLPRKRGRRGDDACVARAT